LEDTPMAKGRISFRVSPKAAKALKALAAERSKPDFRVIGTVKRGKLEIDYDKLSAFTKRLARKDVLFVALNAPFKTRSLIGSV
jgi:hypothetical protein